MYVHTNIGVPIKERRCRGRAQDKESRSSYRLLVYGIQVISLNSLSTTETWLKHPISGFELRKNRSPPGLATQEGGRRTPFPACRPSGAPAPGGGTRAAPPLPWGIPRAAKAVSKCWWGTRGAQPQTSPHVYHQCEEWWWCPDSIFSSTFHSHVVQVLYH